MFGYRTILIADGSTYAALDLAAAVEANGGRVAGPVQTLAEAAAILGSSRIAGAIVDCELDDATELVLRLAEAGVPVIAQTSIPLPAALQELDGRLPVMMRPIDAEKVIITLVHQMDQSDLRNEMCLVPDPGQPRRA